MTSFVLVHSPLVGPATWEPVAEALRRRGATALAPDLGGIEGADRAYWRQHAEAGAAALRGLPAGEQPILVGHSGAGVLLPPIRELAGRPVAGYLFVDAGLPQPGPRMGEGEFVAILREMDAAGERYPNWTDELLSGILPDSNMRRRVLDDMRPQPFAFWEEEIPIFAGWPDAPCAMLRFVPNPAYDDAAEEARARGWPYAELAGGHFHPLVAPEEVTTAMLELCMRAGISH
jgi:hypothetical protein